MTVPFGSGNKEEEQEKRIRRILVALDASPHSMSALEAAVELAENLEAELLGLFVEDINLLRLANLPFAREVGFLSQTTRSLDNRYIERQLHMRARQARQALARLAGRSNVAWSFRVARGAILAELLAAAAEADLTILGRAGWSQVGQRRLGSTTRAVLVQANRLTLVLHRGARIGLPVLVAYDGSGVGRQALLAATQLLRGRNGDLSVLILADDRVTAEKLQAEAEVWLRQQGLEPVFRLLVEPSVNKLRRLVRELGCRVLVLPSPSASLFDEDLPGLFEAVDCPVLLVR